MIEAKELEAELTNRFGLFDWTVTQDGDGLQVRAVLKLEGQSFDATVPVSSDNVLLEAALRDAVRGAVRQVGQALVEYAAGSR